MGLNWKQFELGVLRPTLTGEPEVAVKLVGETLWHESDRLQALGQYPRIEPRDLSDPVPKPQAVFGPGLGIASIEKATWEWMRKNAKYDKWADTIYQPLRYCDYNTLAFDLDINVRACRFRYKLDSRPLPQNDLPSRALYWFKVYNASGVTERLTKFMQDARAIPWVEGVV
jgi:hypothetical protein